MANPDANGWYTAESFPKDGRLVEVWCPDAAIWKISTARWLSKQWPRKYDSGRIIGPGDRDFHTSDAQRTWGLLVTHWRPLREAPPVEWSRQN